MALIHCHECGKEISDSAKHCPHCGCKTSHGKGVTQMKADIFTWVIIMFAAFLGGFLVCGSWLELRSHSPYYWEAGYWKYDEDIKSAFMKLFVGLGALIGSIVAEIRLKKQIKYRNISELHSAACSQSTATPPIEYPPAFIPEDKRKHGPCAKCGNQGIVAECRLPNQFGNFDLCPKCINRYRGQLR